jgi:hypothetical protein
MLERAPEGLPGKGAFVFWRVVEGIELPGQAVLDVRKLGFWASLNQPYRLPGPMAGWSSLGVLLLMI